MRSARAIKFAEYLSTYAILHNIALHDTVLIERRDSSRGFGVYVRDACDAQTTLMVVPAKQSFATSVVERIGVNVSWNTCESTLNSNNEEFSNINRLDNNKNSEEYSFVPYLLTVGSNNSNEKIQSISHNDHESYLALCETLDFGIVSHLTQCSGHCRKWIEWCWRLSLERERAHSPWWGWLQSLPNIDEMNLSIKSTSEFCRIQHSELLPLYEKARKQIDCEIRRAYKYIDENLLHAPLKTFTWAVNVLLSRGITLPTCWNNHSKSTNLYNESVKERNRISKLNEHNVQSPQATDHEETSDMLYEMQTEVAVVPYFDLVNGVVETDDDNNVNNQLNDANVEQISNYAANSKNSDIEIKANTRFGISYESLPSPSSQLSSSSSLAPSSTPRVKNEKQTLLPNAVIDIAMREKDLPEWYLSWINEEARRTGRDAKKDLKRLFDNSYFLCLTLTDSIAASSEVILPYTLPVITTGVFSPVQDVRLTQYIKYMY